LFPKTESNVLFAEALSITNQDATSVCSVVGANVRLPDLLLFTKNTCS